MLGESGLKPSMVCFPEANGREGFFTFAWGGVRGSWTFFTGGGGVLVLVPPWADDRIEIFILKSKGL